MSSFSDEELDMLLSYLDCISFARKDLTMGYFDPDPTSSIREACRSVAREQGGTELVGEPSRAGKETGGEYAGNAERDSNPYRLNRRDFTAEDNVAEDHDRQVETQSWFD